MSEYTKTALVLGAGGFIGSHMVKHLVSQGYWVRGVDVKSPEFEETAAHEFIHGDLRNVELVTRVLEYKGPYRNFYNEIPYKMIDCFDEIYQFAADMGGAGYIFSGEHDAHVMHNSATINLHVLDEVRLMNERLDKYEPEHHPKKQPKIFYSSSACMYPQHNQLEPDNPNCREDSAYPAAPDSEYGWEKLFSERLYLTYNRNHNIPVRIARYHNIFGPEGTWQGGREKAPAAFCRKVAQANNGGEIEVWGDGSRTRSFLYISECIEATRRLMESDFEGPVNIGSEEMITIQNFARLAIKLSGKQLSIKNIDGPLGVHGRNSDNDLYKKRIGWKVSEPLKVGMEKTYLWISEQVKRAKNEIN